MGLYDARSGLTGARRNVLPMCPPCTSPRPTSIAGIGSITSITSTGKSPISTQSAVSQASPSRSRGPASCACASFSSRGRPRKITPKNLTITYPASAATSTTPAAKTGISIRRYGLGISPVKRSPCRRSHSETKPLDGGSPALAITPTSEVTATHGMNRMRPPSFPRFLSWVAWSTEPVPRKRRLLKTAWFAQW